MVVEDATLDAWFHDNPLVCQATDIRFFAGAPIVTRDGFTLGTVCVIDRETRTLSAAQIDGLRSLSPLVVSLIEHEKRQSEEALLASAAVRQGKRAVVLLMLTSSASPQDRERAAAIGIIQGYLTKPLTVDSVREFLAAPV